VPVLIGLPLSDGSPPGGSRQLEACSRLPREQAGLYFEGLADGYCVGVARLTGPIGSDPEGHAPAERQRNEQTMIDLSELKQILEMVREHELSELELERDGFKVRVKKEGVTVVAPPVRVVPEPAPAAGMPPHAPAAVPAASAPPPVPSVPLADEVELAVVKSPIVGTFYRAPEPGAPPFVAVGTKVRKGQVLCIIEAMKLMNEIESEYEGEIVNIYVENGLPVQFGERLFAIRPL
jgi:acetyl-CoA carboxylase biotin carboxyl carrier protein